MKRALILVFAILVIGAAFYWGSGERKDSDGEQESRKKPSDSVDLENSAPNGVAVQATRREDRKSGGPMVIVPSISARTELLNLFKRKEALRTTLLFKKRYADATAHLLGVDPPDLKEIEELRSAMAKALKSVGAEEKQEFDFWLQDEVRKFDPLGTRGKRIINIRIPDDDQKKMTAFSYSTDDYNSEARKIEQGGEIKMPGDVVISSANDKGELTRYSELIQY